MTDLTCGFVRLPLSARRGAASFAKLIRSVRFDAQEGFGWEGKLVQPGSTVPLRDLRPALDWPECPVLLECAGHDTPGWGHRRTPVTYILWVYERGQWREAARSQALRAEWAVELREIARRLIRGRREPVDLRLAARRISELLERELEGLAEAERDAVLGVVHDQIATRVAGAGWRVPLAS